MGEKVFQEEGTAHAKALRPRDICKFNDLQEKKSPSVTGV